MVAGVQVQFPGHAFRRRSGVDAHHGHLRCARDLVMPEGAPVVAGLDVASQAPDGRLCQIAGLFGEVPAAAAA
jgi:hypothetical protein